MRTLGVAVALLLGCSRGDVTDVPVIVAASLEDLAEAGALRGPFFVVVESTSPAQRQAVVDAIVSATEVKDMAGSTVAFENSVSEFEDQTRITLTPSGGAQGWFVIRLDASVTPRFVAPTLTDAAGRSVFRIGYGTRAILSRIGRFPDEGNGRYLAIEFSEPVSLAAGRPIGDAVNVTVGGAARTCAERGSAPLTSGLATHRIELRCGDLPMALGLSIREALVDADGQSPSMLDGSAPSVNVDFASAQAHDGGQLWSVPFAGGRSRREPD